MGNAANYGTEDQMKTISTAIEKTKRPHWLRKHRRMMRNGWTLLDVNTSMVAYSKAIGEAFTVRYFWTSRLKQLESHARLLANHDATPPTPQGR